MINSITDMDNKIKQLKVRQQEMWIKYIGKLN